VLGSANFFYSQCSQEPALACQSFSAALRPTVQTALPAIEFMQEKWETMANLPKYSPVEAGLLQGTKNLRKWYNNMDDTDIYFISLVLDPSIKMEYFKVHWDAEYLRKGMKIFEKVFDEYFLKFGEARPKEPAKVDVTTEGASGARNMGYSSAWMRNAVQARVHAENANADPRREVKEYLAGPLNVLCMDILKWWQEHQVQFPILARIAQDYLAIPGSSVPSERVFSSMRHIGTDFRNSLSPRMFMATQILKGAYKVGMDLGEGSA
jgi:hypothetical protein